MERREKDPQAQTKARDLRRTLESQGKSQEEIHQTLLTMGIAEEEIASWEEEEDYGNLDH